MPGRWPSQPSAAVGFCQQHGIEELHVTTRTATGSHRFPGVPALFEPTALHIWSIGKEALVARCSVTIDALR